MKATVNNADDLAFRFVSGHRALDLLASLGNRHRSPVERLREPADLDRWLTAAGLSTGAKADHEDLHDARRLRETVNRVVRATLGGEAPQANDLRDLNRWARLPALTPQVDSHLRRHWIAERPLRAALALVAREATELLTNPDRTLIRECAAAPNCSLLYLDRSRAGRRRWCEMNRCGSRAKMTSYRDRRNATTGTQPGGHGSRRLGSSDAKGKKDVSS
jgi:predicted RNA-binding Zn ribbon-like protein